MTDAQRKAICEALAYLIKETVPMPKTSAAKQKRAELMQSLINAARPSKAIAASAPVKGGGDASVADVDPSLTPPSQPKPLEVRIIAPDGPVPMVREQTVFGTPAGGDIAD